MPTPHFHHCRRPRTIVVASLLGKLPLCLRPLPSAHRLACKITRDRLATIADESHHLSKFRPYLQAPGTVRHRPPCPQIRWTRSPPIVRWERISGSRRNRVGQAAVLARCPHLE